MAKKAKRRVGASPSDREIRPAAAPVPTPVRQQCLICQHEFEAVADLEQHVRESGHRHFRAMPAPDPGTVTARD